MSIKGGAISFEVIVETGQLKRGLEEAKKRIQGFSDATVEGEKAIESMFDATTENLNIQKQVVKELETQYAKLQKEIGKVAPGRPQQEMIIQANQVKQELDGEREALTQLEATINKNSQAQAKLTTQLRNIVQELARMEQAGLRGSEAYTRLQQEAGHLTDALGDARQQAKILAHDNAGLQGVISAVSGVAGAMSAAQGAVGLFASENENLQKIMVKIQSLMAITIGLQQVANTVNKDSYFRMVTLTKAKNFFAAATTRSSAALVKFGISAGVANVAAKALVGTLTLGLSVAIGLAVAAIDKLNEKREEAQKKLKEQIQAESDARAEMIKTRFELETTMRSIKNFTGTKEQEKEKVEELNRKYGDSFGTYKTLTEWYDAISKKAEDYIQILFLQAKAQSLVNKAVEADQKVQEVKATNNNDVEGSMGWFAKMGLRQAQAESQGAYDAEAAIDEYNKEAKKKAIKAAEDIREGYLQEAEKLQDDIQKLTSKFKIDIKPTTGGTGNNNKDPFTELLASKKRQFAEYSKWLRSSDEGVRKAANVEFATLIKEGDNYESYLKNLKDRLAKQPVSDTRNNQLKAVTNELLDLEKSSYIDDYKKALEEQLGVAGSLLEKLTLIAEKRKDLDKPGTELKEDKTEILDKEQLSIGKEAQEDYNKAMQNYSNYLQGKIDAELSYLDKRKELELQIAKETDAERKKILETQLRTLQVQHTTKKETDYDGLIAEYKTYQQKCADISDNFDKKIALAKEKNNTELVAKLEQEKGKALSSAALNEIENSDLFQELFGNLDNLTVSKMIELRNKLESEWSKLKLSPEELEALRKKLGEVNTTIEQKNPFAALSDAIKRYKKDKDDVTKKDDLKDIFKSVAGSIELVKGSFDAVVGGLNDMGLAGDEVTQQLLGDIGNMLGSAGQLAEGIATMNPVSMIQGGIGLITSAFNVFNVHDRKAERAIQKHATAVKDLETAYKALEHSVKNALGETVYDNQRALINNMRQQQQHLAVMAREEEGKKKSDGDKVKEYKEQYAELERQIEDTIAEIAQSITQTTAKDLANQLADALVEAYGKGEDAATAFEEVSRQVMQNAVKNALKMQFLERPLQDAIKQLQRDMGFDDEGNGSFSGLTQAGQNRLKNAVAAIGANFSEAMKMYEGLFKDLEESTDPTTSLSGAIKGASQESIDLLTGQTNAVRVNQVESIEILRSQLLHLASIDSKIGISNKHLEQIERNTNNNYDPLRSQGLI